MSDWFAKKKILVPVDFSQESIKAVDEALTMADSSNNVLLLHVAPDLDVTTPGVMWETMSEVSQRQHVLQTFASTFDDAKYKGVQFHAAVGDAGRKIIELAEQENVDLIVMPSHGRTGFKRLLIGSVAERVLRLAHLPVLVLRH